MSLFDFFFPEQAQATYLRSIARSQRGKRTRSPVGGNKVEFRVRNLENDLGYVSLILAALLQKLDEKEVVDRDDVKAIMAELDELDGDKDNRLDINVLRGIGQ